MFYRNRYPYYRRPEGVPGCGSCLFMAIAFVIVCWFVVSSGTLARLMSNQAIALPNVSHLVFAQAADPPSYTVAGKPTLGTGFVNEILSRAHSPAMGTGQALYDLSVRYQIDDAYALAFFQHESSYGTTGMAIVTRSLGNIRCSSGYNCINGYRAYQSWEEGYADWYHLMRTLYVNQWHLVTVQQIVPVYAPASDHNDVPGYIRAVEQAVDAWRRGEVQL